MALSISDFIGHIKKNNVARINRFDIVFTLPEALVALLNQGDEVSPIGSYKNTNQTGNRNPVTAERMMSLSCLATEIPAVGANTTDTDYGTYARRIALGRNVHDFPTSFIITGNYIEKKIFDAWQAIIFKEDRHRVQYYNDYITSLTVTCYDMADKPVYEFELTEAWPVNVGAVQLDRSSQNTQMLLDVQWAFYRIKHDNSEYDAKYVGSNTSGTKTIVSNTVVNSQPVVQSAVGNNSLKQVQQLRDMIKGGTVSRKDALKLVRQMAQSFKTAKDVPQNDAVVVSKSMSDLEASLDDNETIIEVPYD